MSRPSIPTGEQPGLLPHKVTTLLLFLCEAFGATRCECAERRESHESQYVTYVKNAETTPTIKNRITRFLAVGIALCVVFTGMPGAGAEAFLPDQFTIYSTVPPNGDLNPYGVAFVPPGFQSGTVALYDRGKFWSQISITV